MSAATIYALASGRGAAGIAVIRVSGAVAKAAAWQLTGKDLPVRRAQRVELRRPEAAEILDQGLAIYFPGPASFTGEDVVELHVHGGIAVIDGVLSALSEIDGLRMAEPGEFTRRGFENGKLDLTAAEGVADLVAAETEAQRRQALRQMGGALAEFSEDCRARLVGALAHWEAAIDFSDEELPADLEDAVTGATRALIADIERALADGGRGERLRQGFEIVILGPPNAGKSSLLNRLAARDAAIVSAQAGTTRDVVEVHADIGGYAVVLADTAGLRSASDDIEQEGIRRARSRGAAADFKIIMLDGEAWPDTEPDVDKLIDDTAIVVLNKCDLLSSGTPESWKGRGVLAISAKTGDGIDALMARIEKALAMGQTAGDAPVVTRARHRQALEDAVDGLRRFLAAPDRMGHPELGAEDLRMAARALGRVTGAVDVEYLLDVIFADFCIGK